MHNSGTRRRHPIVAMMSGNLEAWLRSPRTILLLLFVVVLCFLEVNWTLHHVLFWEGITLHWVEAPYKMLEYGVEIYMSSGLLFVMISEIPRKHSYQNNMLIRSNRRQWLTAQIMYCILMAVTVLLLLVVCVLVFSFASTEHIAGWSDSARMMDGSMLEKYGVVPQYVREHYTPGTAILYAALPIFCFWFSMIMVILLSSSLGSSFIGQLVCAFALLVPYVLNYVDIPFPTQFATVKGLNPDWNGPELYRKTICTYVVLNGAMILAIYWRLKKTDLVFCKENMI